MITIAYQATNDEAKDRLYEQLKSMLGDLGMHHHHLLPHNAYLKNEIPVAGVAHRPVRVGSGQTPARRCSMSIARPTNLTTCTSPTRASFPASGPSTRRSRRWPTRSGSAITCWSGWARPSPRPARRGRAHDERPQTPRRHRRRRVRRPRLRAEAGRARRRPRHADRPATTTTSSSRCSTRWPPRSWRRAISPFRCARCSPTRTTSTSSSARSSSVDPASAARSAPTTEGRHRPATSLCSPPGRSRISSRLRARPSTPSRSTLSMTPTGCAHGSWGCSKTPTATPSYRARARSTSSSSAAAPTGVEVAGAIAEMLR